MDRLEHHVLYLARFTLEARTALSIGTGGPDGVYDHPIVRDANGLPMIPGTSLAGVLRHLWIADQGGRAEAANDLFGYQARDQGESSRLEVAHCPLQDSQGRPAEGLLIGAAGAARQRDPLYQAALATADDPLFRDRVRLTHRGVASHQGKFDRGVLAAGHRFSGELRLWATQHPDPNGDPDWEALLALLADPRLRLGGATRAGLGALELIDLHTVRLNLKDQHDIGRFARLGPGLGDLVELKRRAPGSLPRHQAATRLTLRLVARDFWRIGQGEHPVGKYHKEPDLVPKLEPLVRWTDGRGQLEPRVALLPGASVKGALAHRVAFHWNALNGQFAEDLGPARVATWDKAEDCAGVRALFGYANDRASAAGRSAAETGRAGQVIVDDVQLDLAAAQRQQQVQLMIHNCLDRFTGGVRERMLFTEELLHGQQFDLTLTLLPGVATADASARRALARALIDLCSGRLALGGGTTKGHGHFSGHPDTATRAWLAAQGEPWTEPEPLEDAA